MYNGTYDRHSDIDVVVHVDIGEIWENLSDSKKATVRR